MPAPREEERRPRTGHWLSIFRRAIERRNLTIAEATARERLRVSPTDVLELTSLIARKDPRRHPRVAARWLLRYLEEVEDATIDEVALAASCLPCASRSSTTFERRLPAALLAPHQLSLGAALPEPVGGQQECGIPADAASDGRGPCGRYAANLDHGAR